jgi:hypothetical protein
MSLKIGFPIVHKDGKCDAVWIATARRSRGEKTFVKWNNKTLNPDKPFDGNPTGNNIIKQILSHQSIIFTCEAVSPVSKDGSYSVEIKGDSFGLALSIASHYEIPSVQSPDFEILLTGKVENNNPQPLKDANASEHKRRICNSERIHSHRIRG